MKYKNSTIKLFDFNSLTMLLSSFNFVQNLKLSWSKFKLATNRRKIAIINSKHLFHYRQCMQVYCPVEVCVAVAQAHLFLSWKLYSGRHTLLSALLINLEGMRLFWGFEGFPIMLVLNRLSEEKLQIVRH
jgi:hypothetical protein